MFDPTSHAIHVRPGDLDSQGHVNNARVLEYFEHGRWSWLRHHRLDFGRSVAAVVMRAEVDYGREIGWGELTVCTALRPYDESAYRVVFDQHLCARDADGAVLASAVVQVAFVDTSDRTLVSVEDALASVYATAEPPLLRTVY